MNPPLPDKPGLAVPLPSHLPGRRRDPAAGNGPALRRAKIVATLGPATRPEAVLRRLLAAGVDVARLNFSHGTQDEHAAAIADVRRIAAELGRQVAVLQDLQGPKIRTGPLAGGGPVELEAGGRLVITTRLVPGDASVVSTTYAGLPNDVRPGDRVLLADGLIELRVLDVEGPDVICRVINGGPLGEHKGINLPGVPVSAPALTDKDRADLIFGLAQGVDYVALSFVRSAEDAEAARRIMAEQRAHVPLIAKIEKPEALAHLEGVLRAFDGVMVARGDLGVELSPEAVPVWQKVIIRMANDLGKPVITATQMLESMITNPRPTRAEASDVANAVFDGADAVMLSAETAAGAYPVTAVETMARIIMAAETAPPDLPPRSERTWSGYAIARAACGLAEDLNVPALVVLTQSGRTGQLVSKERPDVPIIAFTDEAATARRLALWWGISAVVTPFRRTTDMMLTDIEAALLALGLAAPGDNVVVVGSTPIAARGRTNFIKIHHLARPGRHNAGG
ncbi:MAG: pyruvate kinase [Chloroflexi bacterium]|nr:pyruvate kinase [Chloroflexota bacterium]